MCRASWAEIELINKADEQWFCWAHHRFRLSEEWSTPPERLHFLWRWSLEKGREEGSRRALNWSRTKVGCGEYTQDAARRASASGCLSGAVCQHRRLCKQKPQPKTMPTACTSISWLNWWKWKYICHYQRLVPDEVMARFHAAICSSWLFPPWSYRCTSGGHLSFLFLLSSPTGGRFHRGWRSVHGDLQLSTCNIY